MERLRHFIAWVGPRRLLTAAVASPFIAVLAVWVLRVPPPPIENMIPVAPTVAPQSVAPVLLDPLGTVPPTRIAVHVVGAVRNPGVFHLEPGSRGDDALRAAGGAADNADVRRVNLAAPVRDGEQLYIPRVGERVTPVIAGPAATLPDATTSSPGPSDASSSRTTVPLIVDLNRAMADDLDRLPGVGPSTAKAIIDHRTRNGPFASVDDLLAVRGIGPAKLAEIRKWVRV